MRSSQPDSGFKRTLLSTQDLKILSMLSLVYKRLGTEFRLYFSLILLSLNALVLYDARLIAEYSIEEFLHAK